MRARFSALSVVLACAAGTLSCAQAGQEHGREPGDAPEQASPSAGGETPGDEAHGSGEPAAVAAPEPLGTVYGPETTTIEARPGERFSLALPHDPAATWTVDPELDQSVARLVEQRSEGGQHYVLFDAVGIGPTDLRLRLRNPDSPPPGPPAREVTVRIRVELAQ